MSSQSFGRSANVLRTSRSSAEQVRSGTSGGVLDARLRGAHQDGHEVFLAGKPGQEREVDVHGFARLAPALDRESADETVAPPVRLADGLEVGGRPDQAVHRRRFSAKSRCCSMSPDVGLGARGASR